MPSPIRRQVPIIPSLRATMTPRQPEMTPTGPVMIVPSQPGALTPEQGTLVRLPGVNFPPAGAVAVDVIGDADIAAGAIATLVTIQIPDTFRLRVWGIGFGADDEVALRFLTWSIRTGGDAVPGYIAVNAAVGSIRQLADIFNLVGSSQTFTVQASIDLTAVNTYHYICRVRGHFYTEKEHA